MPFLVGFILETISGLAQEGTVMVSNQKLYGPLHRLPEGSSGRSRGEIVVALEYLLDHVLQYPEEMLDVQVVRKVITTAQVGLGQLAAELDKADDQKK